MQPDQALQPLEAKFHSPPQAIQRQHVIGGEFRCLQRGHQNEPVGRCERVLRQLVTVLLRLAAGLAATLRGIGLRLTGRDQAQRQWRAAAAADPDRFINPIRLALAKHAEQIKRLAVPLLPAGVLPGGPHHDIAAVRQHIGNAVRLQVDTVAEADLAPHHGDTSLLAAMLVGQHELPEPLAGQIECTVDTPQSVLSFRRAARFRHRRGVDDPDQTAPGLRP